MKPQDKITGIIWGVPFSGVIIEVSKYYLDTIIVFTDDKTKSERWCYTEQITTVNDIPV